MRGTLRKPANEEKRGVAASVLLTLSGAVHPFSLVDQFGKGKDSERG